MCDYCDGTVIRETGRCTGCGYDYSALIASGEYSLPDSDEGQSEVAPNPAYSGGYPATKKQTGFIGRLQSDRILGESDVIKLGRALERGFNTKEASDIIKWLLSKPVKPVKITAPVAVAESAAAQSVPVERVEIADGMWILGEVIYKVQVAVHGSGRLYAKRLVVSPEFGDDGGKAFTVRFEYAPGAIRELEAGGRKLTLEEAKAFGALYGTCCDCGRTLTRESSIAAGIGPICAGKF